jgi:ribose-phosphate pyrophosphokinase
VNDVIMEQLIMIDAAKRASAKRITAVMPYYGYARQDRKSKGREPITAKLVADLFTASGVDRLMSVDLHSGQIQGFFNGPVDHLTAMPVLLDYLRETSRGDYVIVAPDTGRTKVAEQAANALQVDVAAIYKRRSKDKISEVEARGVMGEDVIAGKLCVLIDDMIDTAGTICAAAEVLLAKGASEVWAMATHGVLSGPAIDRLKNAPLSRVVVTDTLPIGSEKEIDKLEVVSVAGVLARTIDAVFEDRSVSQIFGGANQS